MRLVNLQLEGAQTSDSDMENDNNSFQHQTVAALLESSTCNVTRMKQLFSVGILRFYKRYVVATARGAESNIKFSGKDI